MWMMDNDDKYDVEKGDNDEDDDDDGDDDGDIYIMMSVCLFVCKEKSSLFLEIFF